MYYHGGETAGYNSFMGYDPANKVTLVVWTNLPVSLDEIPTANALVESTRPNLRRVTPNAHSVGECRSLTSLCSTLRRFHTSVYPANV